MPERSVPADKGERLWKLNQISRKEQDCQRAGFLLTQVNNTLKLKEKATRARKKTIENQANCGAPEEKCALNNKWITEAF